MSALPAATLPGQGAALAPPVKIVLFANTDWYLYNFRRSLALALQAQGYELLLISPPGPYGQKLRELGLRWEPVPMDRRSLHPSSEARLLAWLVALFRTERPALVHGFTVKCAVYGSLAARLAGVPATVNAFAGMGYVFTSKDAKARVLQPLVRMLMHAVLDGGNARLILQNPDDVKLFERAGFVDRKHIRLIPGSGVDCSRFTERGIADQPASPLRVLLATRLLWDKGVAEYIVAARQLRGEGRAIRFLLAGDPGPGNPAAVTDAHVRAWQAEGVIEWLGHVDDMPTLLASVDVMVLPSYREGLPKSLIEAAACAMPLVTTDVPGCREVVDDGVNGLLVPPRDAKALAHAIARLHDDPAMAARLGAAARVKALGRFCETIVIADTVAVYRELLEPAPVRVGSPVRPGVATVVGGLLLASSVALVMVAVVLPPDVMAWLRGDYRWFGRSLNWLEMLTPRIDMTHVILFAWIGLLLRSLWPKLSWWRIALPLLGLAVGSELIQFFVPGRTARISDVGFDMLGGGIGMVVGMVLRALLPPPRIEIPDEPVLDEA